VPTIVSLLLSSLLQSTAPPLQIELVFIGLPMHGLGRGDALRQSKIPTLKRPPPTAPVATGRASFTPASGRRSTPTTAL
jgi:hypothetical protein